MCHLHVRHSLFQQYTIMRVNVKCPFHQASALEVNGPSNLNVLPMPLLVECQSSKHICPKLRR